MDHGQQLPAFERLLDQVVDCLTPDVAFRIAGLRMDLPVQVRMIELSRKAEAGSLSEVDEWEYQGCLQALEMITALQERAEGIRFGSSARVRPSIAGSS